MRRCLAALLLAPLLGSCQPPDIIVHAAFIGHALAFVAADPDDAESGFCWREATVLDDSLQPAWRFEAPGSGACDGLVPLFYGRDLDGAESAAPARRLEPGRLYLVEGDAIASVYGAFALTRTGKGFLVHNVDPQSPAAAALRERWWRSRTPGPPPAGEPAADPAT
jgi:hypothetical protein